MPERAANWGLRYSYGRFDLQINGNWQGEYRVSALSNTPTTANNGILYHTARELWNISASYKLIEELRTATRGPQHLQRARHHLLQRPRPRPAVHHLRLDVELRHQGKILSSLPVPKTP